MPATCSALEARPYSARNSTAITAPHASGGAPSSDISANVAVPAMLPRMSNLYAVSGCSRTNTAAAAPATSISAAVVTRKTTGSATQIGTPPVCAPKRISRPPSWEIFVGAK